MLGALVLTTGATLAPPYLIGKAVSAALGGHSTTLALLVAALLGAALIAWATSSVQTYLVSWVGERALQDLRIRIFTHLQGMSIGFFTRNRPGVLISRITNDVDALEQLISTGVVTLFSSTLTLVGVVVIMLALDVKLALLVFLTFPCWRSPASSSGSWRPRSLERIAEVTAYLQESLSGVQVVRSFAQEERHVARMGELNELNRQANLKTVYLNASYFPAVELLSALGTAVILLYGGYQALDLSTEAAARPRSASWSPSSGT